MDRIGPIVAFGANLEMNVSFKPWHLAVKKLLIFNWRL